MAYAKKCDRCGEFYNETDNMVAEFKGSKYTFTEPALKNSSTGHTAHFDFCPACARKLYNFFNAYDGKTKKEVKSESEDILKGAVTDVLIELGVEFKKPEEKKEEVSVKSGKE